ncbi:hypothetical protein [Deinococcus hohokamensis]|uniref:Uncharacterized protein n=1 Tax=Deinococcus hohokamensis TaxID=309883 RepID=A0ABV9IAI5_9DEIO
MPRFLLSVLVLSALLGPARAGGGTTPGAAFAPPSLPPGPVRDLKLAADPQGRLILAVITDAGQAESGRGTFTARRVGAWQWQGQSWQPLGGVLNYDQPRPAANLNLALDDQGTPLLVWNENYGDNDVVVFRAWTGGAWTDWAERYLGISSPQAAKTRAVVARSGEPVLVWGENVREGVGTLLTLRRWQGGEWLRSAPLSGPRGYPRQPALALDARGVATVAWLEGDVAAAQVLVARQDGARWTRLGGPLSHAGRRYLAAPRLVLDPQGRPIVAWLEDTGGRDTLFVSRWTGARWSSLGGAISRDFALAPALVLDAKGQPVLAWTEERGSLGRIFLARWTGAAWTVSGPLNRDPSQDARSPALAAEPSGTVVLGWREAVGGVYQAQLRRFGP